MAQVVQPNTVQPRVLAERVPRLLKIGAGLAFLLTSNDEWIARPKAPEPFYDVKRG
jgi:hypothetical protein